jgi:soluble lytic murein transglycosylase-like protein
VTTPIGAIPIGLGSTPAAPSSHLAANRPTADFFGALSRSYRLRVAASGSKRAVAGGSGVAEPTYGSPLDTVIPDLTINGVEQAANAAVSAASTSPSGIHAMVGAAARQAGIPPALLAAVVEVESGFQSNAVSKAGARGLTQLMDGTARSLGVTNSFDPWQNLTGGARLLRGLLNKYHGSVPLALAAYNAGSGAVDAAGGIPPYPETQRYVPLVLAVYHRYAAESAQGVSE